MCHFSSSASEGEITVVTDVEEGVETKTMITTWPLKGAFVIGIVFFSLGTIAVAFSETFVRYLIKQRMEKADAEQQKTTPNTPDLSGIWQDPIRPN